MCYIRLKFNGIIQYTLNVLIDMKRNTERTQRFILSFKMFENPKQKFVDIEKYRRVKCI